MAIKVIVGEIKANNQYYSKGDILESLSQSEEKWLIREGMAEEFEADDGDFEETELDIDSMTEKQLCEFAQQNEIDISGAKGKVQIKERILNKLENMNDSDDGGA